MENGYVLLHRKLFSNRLWLAERFTKAQAWVDLFANANHKDGSFWVRGIEVKVKRGQLGWSEVNMAKRWGWNRKTVRRFLNYLEMEQQITQQKTPQTSITTILKYGDYQDVGTTKRTSKGTTNGTAEGTQTKNVKEELKNETQTEQGSGVSGTVINLFKELNPSYKILFKRKNQHDSANRLLEREGFERLQKIVLFLAVRKSDRYCPQISTPLQLEEKWAALEKYAMSLKKASEINTNPTWKIWT